MTSFLIVSSMMIHASNIYIVSSIIVLILLIYYPMTENSKVLFCLKLKISKTIEPIEYSISDKLYIVHRMVLGYFIFRFKSLYGFRLPFTAPLNLDPLETEDAAISFCIKVLK